jgi:hypothetical protein
MRIRRAKSAVVVLSFLAALALAGSGDVSAAAPAASITVPISGTVDGGPESVSLSGSLQIASTLVADTTVTTRKVRLTIELVNGSGTGLTSGAKYVMTGEDRLLRPLALSDHVDLMFPFFRATEGARSARSAMASVTLKFDLLTGSLTGATATVSSPRLG